MPNTIYIMVWALYIYIYIDSLVPGIGLYISFPMFSDRAPSFPNQEGGPIVDLIEPSDRFTPHVESFMHGDPSDTCHFRRVARCRCGEHCTKCLCSGP